MGGYALLAAGLCLPFDTFTFLLTNWSPLKVPMYTANESAIGYLLAVAGVVLLLAPTLIRILDKYAPDHAIGTGNGGIAHPSVENHVQGRLPPSAKSLVLRKASSWIAVAFGLLSGLLCLSISGSSWLPNRAINPYWYKPLIGIV